MGGSVRVDGRIWCRIVSDIGLCGNAKEPLVPEKGGRELDVRFTGMTLLLGISQLDALELGNSHPWWMCMIYAKFRL
jgi:hypothetical protein